MLITEDCKTVCIIKQEEQHPMFSSYLKSLSLKNIKSCQRQEVSTEQQKVLPNLKTKYQENNNNKEKIERVALHI